MISKVLNMQQVTRRVGTIEMYISTREGYLQSGEYEAAQDIADQLASFLAEFYNHKPGANLNPLIDKPGAPATMAQP